MSGQPMKVEGHRVAVAAVPSLVIPADAYLWVQCECGWRRVCPPVVTAELLIDAIAGHLAEALGGTLIGPPVMRT